MEFYQAIILSVVEGVTEFLPISSTGHLVLTSQLLKIPQTEFIKSFEIIIQLGAILAVVILYWKKFLQSKLIWKKVFAAFLPTAFVGFVLYKFIKVYLIGNSTVSLIALFLGGFFLIIFELMHKEEDSHISDIERLDIKTSMLIGFIQSLSVIPGISRAGASILGGLTLGLKRKTAVEFSFLLAVPTMIGATGLDLIKTNFKFTINELLLLGIGFIGSFLVALIVVKWFVKYIRANNFILFGVYRIVFSILFWLFFIS